MKLALLLPIIFLAGCVFNEPKETESIVIEITGDYNRNLEGMIIRQEGYQRHPYPDAKGTQSVGYGRNLTTSGISEEEALMLLRNDIDRIEEALTARFPVFDRLDNTRRAVLISMTYGLGIQGISEFKDMWRNINSRDYLAAASEIIISDYCNQVGMRCIELASMMGSGKWR